MPQIHAPTAPGKSYHKFKTFGIGALNSRVKRLVKKKKKKNDERKKRNRPPRASRDDDDAQKAKRRGASKASWISRVITHTHHAFGGEDVNLGSFWTTRGLGF